MNKRRILGLDVLFDNGDVKNYTTPGTFSESRNGRKDDPLEWTEYHITWVVYDKPEPKLVESTPEPEHRREDAWCGVHKMAPGECFKLHNPTAFSGRAADYLKRDSEDFIRAVEGELKKLKKVPILEKFDISDLLEGYGNGQH